MTLWTRYWNFGFHESCVIFLTSWVTIRLSRSSLPHEVTLCCILKYDFLRFICSVFTISAVYSAGDFTRMRSMKTLNAFLKPEWRLTQQTIAYCSVCSLSEAWWMVREALPGCHSDRPPKKWMGPGLILSQLKMQEGQYSKPFLINISLVSYLTTLYQLQR
jgi:hypothetical protein